MDISSRVTSSMPLALHPLKLAQRSSLVSYRRPWISILVFKLFSGGHPSKVDHIALLSIVIGTGVFATTIQTQDFKDVEGDRLIGRQTLPIVWPEVARHTVLPLMLAWSICLSIMWDIGAEVAVPFIGLAVFVGLRFFVKRDIPADQLSFYLYNVRTPGHLYTQLLVLICKICQVWLSMAHSLPGYWRIFRAQ